MLSPQETEAVAALLAELEARPQASATDVARLMARLPPRPEAIHELLELARQRQSPVLGLVEGTVRHFQIITAQPRPAEGSSVPAGPPLHEVLSASVPYSVKVAALMECVRRRDRTAVPLVRQSIQIEWDPFVLATMASLLGRLGDRSDAQVLVGLLRNLDPRVVANALEALALLEVPLEAAMMVPFVAAEDARVRVNALAILSRTEAGRALEAIESRVRSADVAERAGMAYLLGDMGREARALALLVDRLGEEPAGQVLRQIGAAIHKHVGSAGAMAVIPPLVALRNRLDGERRAIVEALLAEIATAAGLVRAQVDAMGPPAPAQEPRPGVAGGPGEVTPGPVGGSPQAPGGAETPISLCAPAPPPAPFVSSALASASIPARGGLPAQGTRTPAVPSWAMLGVVALVGLGWVAHAVVVGDRPARRAGAPEAREQAAVGPSLGQRLRAQGPKVSWSGAKERIGGDVRDAQDDPAIPRLLGPVGAPVDVDGKVLRTWEREAVLRREGRSYFVREIDGEALRVGQRARVAGRIAGVSQGGLVFIDGRRR